MRCAPVRPFRSQLRPKAPERALLLCRPTPRGLRQRPRTRAGGGAVRRAAPHASFRQRCTQQNWAVPDECAQSLAMARQHHLAAGARMQPGPCPRAALDLPHRANRPPRQVPSPACPQPRSARLPQLRQRRARRALVASATAVPTATPHCTPCSSMCRQWPRLSRLAMDRSRPAPALLAVVAVIETAVPVSAPRSPLWLHTTRMKGGAQLASAARRARQQRGSPGAASGAVVPLSVPISVTDSRAQPVAGSPALATLPRRCRHER